MPGGGFVVGRVYTLVNQKGGVGKTTTAINLGAYLVQFGQRVLIVDIDPQANATSSLGVNKHTVKGGTYEALMGGVPAPGAGVTEPTPETGYFAILAVSRRSGGGTGQRTGAGSQTPPGD